MTKNKVQFLFMLCAIICVALISGNAHGAVIQYDGSAAVRYAARWCNEINKTQYKDFSNLGGDCTNFTSQVVIAATTGTNGVFSCSKNAGVIGLDNKTKGITFASQIGSVLKDDLCFTEVSLSEIKGGEIIVWGDSQKTWDVVARVYLNMFPFRVETYIFS